MSSRDVERDAPQARSDTLQGCTVVPVQLAQVVERMRLELELSTAAENRYRHVVLSIAAANRYQQAALPTAVENRQMNVALLTVVERRQAQLPRAVVQIPVERMLGTLVRSAWLGDTVDATHRLSLCYLDEILDRSPSRVYVSLYVALGRMRSLPQKRLGDAKPPAYFGDRGLAHLDGAGPSLCCIDSPDPHCVGAGDASCLCPCSCPYSSPPLAFSSREYYATPYPALTQCQA